MNDVFSKNSEAWGQYEHQPQVNYFIKKEKNIPNCKPSYYFDLCRLSMTILEENKNKIKNKNLLDLLNTICIDKFGNHYCDMNDDFSLYINISKNAINSLPIDILNNKIFKNFRVKKNKFPHKSYYSF